MTGRSILDDWANSAPDRKERIERIFLGAYALGWRAGAEAKIAEVIMLAAWWNLFHEAYIEGRAWHDRKP